MSVRETLKEIVGRLEAGRHGLFEEWARSQTGYPDQVWSLDNHQLGEALARLYGRQTLRQLQAISAQRLVLMDISAVFGETRARRILADLDHTAAQAPSAPPTNADKAVSPAKVAVAVAVLIAGGALAFLIGRYWWHIIAFSILAVFVVSLVAGLAKWRYWPLPFILSLLLAYGFSHVPQPHWLAEAQAQQAAQEAAKEAAQRAADEKRYAAEEARSMAEYDRLTAEMYRSLSGSEVNRMIDCAGAKHDNLTKWARDCDHLPNPYDRNTWD